MLNGIIDFIIGGVITGLFMIWQNHDNHKYNLRIINEEEERLENAVLQAIETEIKVNWERYNENIKPLVDKLRELTYNCNMRFISFQNIHEDKRYFYNLLSYKISISQDYFTIYKGNSSFIGKIKNDSLRKEIVSTYTNTKGIIDKILLFGLFQDSLRDSAKEIKEPNSGNAKFVSIEDQVVKEYKKLLTDLSFYILQVKNEQDRLDAQIKQLLILLESEMKQTLKPNNSTKNLKIN
ncbi:MAG: hypothetical protein M1576_00265 [Deltaproteobacteria bacterium]|nr:hypothetical protein [Deltaproteobacteria bacterium]